MEEHVHHQGGAHVQEDGLEPAVKIVSLLMTTIYTYVLFIIHTYNNKATQQKQDCLNTYIITQCHTHRHVCTYYIILHIIYR